MAKLFFFMPVWRRKTSVLAEYVRVMVGKSARFVEFDASTNIYSRRLENVSNNFAAETIYPNTRAYENE